MPSGADGNFHPINAIDPTALLYTRRWIRTTVRSRPFGAKTTASVALTFPRKHA